MSASLSRFFNLRSGEGQIVALLLVHSFFIGISQILLRTTATTLYLVKFNAQDMPYVYIGSAIAAPLVGFIYARLQDKLSFRKLLIFNLSLLLAMLIVFRVIIEFAPESGFVSLGLYIWYYVQDVLINLEFWTLAGQLFDVQQGKRLFAMIGSGEMVARVISGFLVAPLVRLIGTPNLLLGAAAGMAGSLGLLVIITSRFKMIQSEGSKSKAQNKPQTTFRAILKSRYVLLMVSLALIALVGYYFVDLSFIGVARDQYPNRDDLAGFLGAFEAVNSIFGLVGRLFLAGPLISKFGVAAGLLALPLATCLGAIAIAFSGTFLSIPSAIFWLASITKLLVVGFRRSTDKSAFRILYQPMPANQRLRAQTFIESVIEPAASGIAGIILLLLQASAVQLAFLLAGLTVIWVTIILFLTRDYRTMLIRVLSQRSFDDFSLSEFDAAAMQIFKTGLESRYPGEVIYFLNILESANHPSLEEFLKKLLSHSEPDVRKVALEKIEQFNYTSALRRVRDRLKLESLPQLRGLALRTLMSLGETETLDVVIPYLEDPDPQIKMGAIVGLLRSGGIEGILVAGQVLIELVNSSDSENRIFAAKILGEVGIPNFYRPLLQLLKDADPHVRQQALIAAGKLKNPRLLPLVMDNLASYRTRASATSALVSTGDGVISVFEPLFIPENPSRESLISMAAICGKIGNEHCDAFLAKQMNFPDPDIQHQVLLSLSQCQYRAALQDHATVVELMRSKARQVAWLLAIQADISSDQASNLLHSAIDQTLTRLQEQIFCCLGFIYSPEAIQSAWKTLESPRSTPEKRSYALEMLDVMVSQEVKSFLMPLIENLNPPERLRRLHSLFPQISQPADKRCLEIAALPADQASPWMKTCALWAFRESHPDAYMSMLKELQQNPSPANKDILSLLPVSEDGEKSMLSTIEKIIILKTVSIFSETPEEVLAHIASSTEEFDFKEGDTITHKGDTGQSLYIIIEGKVRIHDEEKTLAHLSNRDIFGELAILDPRPDPASVTAVAATHLLKLDKPLFDELLTDRIEVSQGIIRVLTRRLRAAMMEQRGFEEQKSEKSSRGVLDGIFDNLLNF